VAGVEEAAAEQARDVDEEALDGAYPGYGGWGVSGQDGGLVGGLEDSEGVGEASERKRESGDEISLVSRLGAFR